MENRSFVLLLACAGASVAACSSGSDAGSDSTPQAISSGTSAHPVGDVFPTPTGNRVEVLFALPGSGKSNSHACKPAQTELDIVYFDDRNFFAGAPSIKVRSKTTDTSGHNTEATDSPALGLGAYIDSHCIDGAATNLSTVTFAFMSAAGDKSDSDNSQDFTVDLRKAPPSTSTDLKGERDTIVGNHVSVDIALQPPPNGNCASPMLDVTYQDKTHFFGSADSLNMFYRVNHKDGTKEDHNATIRPFGHPNTYESVRLCFGWDANDTSLELAFSDPGKKKWDSNDKSQNYVFTFH